MISLFPVKDKNQVQALFSKKGLDFNEFSGCVTALSGEEQLGFCLYYLTDKEMTVLYLEPMEDLPLSDGILRSTLHVAAERSITKINYTVENEAFFEKLGFIKSKEKRLLNIDLLFGGCNCCKN